MKSLDHCTMCSVLIQLLNGKVSFAFSTFSTSQGLETDDLRVSHWSQQVQAKWATEGYYLLASRIDRLLGKQAI